MNVILYDIIILFIFNVFCNLQYKLINHLINEQMIQFILYLSENKEICNLTI